MVQGPRTLWQRDLLLGAGAVGAVCRGIAYLPHTRTSEVRQLWPVEAWMPLTWWAIVWIATGVLLAASIMWRRLSMPGMAVLAGLLTAWAVSYWWSWWALDVSRAWVTGGLFLMAAVWAGVIASLLERGRRG